MAAVAGKSIQIWSLPNGKLIETLSWQKTELADPFKACTVAISIDGNLLARNIGKDGVRLYRLADAHDLVTKRGGDGGLCFDRFGDSTRVTTLPPCYTYALSSDGSMVAGTEAEAVPFQSRSRASNTTRIWSTQDGHLISHFTVRRIVEGRDLKFARDGKILLVVDEGNPTTTCTLVSVKDGTILRTVYCDRQFASASCCRTLGRIG